MLCPCSCGQLAEVSHDDETWNRWQVEVSTCHARAALDTVTNKHGQDIDPGTMLAVRLLPDGDEASDPFEYDYARAGEEYEKNMRKLGRVV